MANQTVVVAIESSVIQVGGEVYRTKNISQMKVVSVEASALELLTMGRRYAILARISGEDKVLVASRDQEKIYEVFTEIKKAMSEQERGNKAYVSNVVLNGDVVNQSGNFGTGFNNGSIKL